MAGLGAGLIGAALWLRFFVDNGLVDWKIVLCYALVFAGALMLVYGCCHIWLAGTLTASKAPGLYILVRSMTCAAVVLAASGIYRTWRYDDALIYHSTESAGFVSSHSRKGKSRAHYHQYRFEYEGRSYTGEFADPQMRLHIGDTIRILHGAQNPQYNHALVDWIYEP